MYGRILFTLSSSLIKAYNGRFSSKKGIYGQFHIMDITFREQFFGKKTFSCMLLFKVPILSKFLFSYLILYIAQGISVKKSSTWIKCILYQKFQNRLNLPPFWSTIRTSLPWFGMSCDVDT